VPSSNKKKLLTGGGDEVDGVLLLNIKTELVEILKFTPNGKKLRDCI